jgi:hypothetical protein
MRITVSLSFIKKTKGGVFVNRNKRINMMMMMATE